VNFSAWIPVFLLVGVFTVILLVHLARHAAPYMPKWAWALLIILTAPAGGFIYLAIVVAGAGTGREDAEGRPGRT
jgi:hypothetical protein